MIFTKNKAVYEHDIQGFEGKASKIVFPESINELQSIVKFTKGDIVVRGSGMSFVGGCVPDNSVVVDMSKMNKILEIEPSRKKICVEAGVIIDELNHELEKYNLEFPISTLFSGIQTIGGVIALNATGDRELKYGRIRNWIDSLEIINGRGELVEVSKTDASDFVGMEGITGIITKAKLRLTTKKTRTFSILKSDYIENVLNASKKLKLDQEVSMVDMLGKQLSVMLGLENKYHLFVEYESNRGYMKGASYCKFLRMKNRAYHVLASNGYTLLENPKFFTDKLKDFAEYLEQNHLPYFCNLGSGAVYTCFRPEEPRKHKEVLDVISSFRANLSYTLGKGIAKKEAFDKNEKEIIKRIKTRHDPEWKFNRNKIIDYPAESKEEMKNIASEIKTEEKSIGGKKAEEKDEGPSQKPAEIKEEQSELQQTQKTSEKIPEKTPEQEMLEFLDEQKIDDILSSKPAEKAENADREDMFKAAAQNTALNKRQPEFTEEEKEKIKKIAGGFFGKGE